MYHSKVAFSKRGPGLIPFPRVTIASLPDNVLLDIFDFYQLPSYVSLRWWHALAHVCRRWRYIVFDSPLRLRLQLECDASTPVKKMLKVWPRSLPIVIRESRPRLPLSGANIFAALKHHDRVAEIYLDAKITLLKRLYKAMEKPYPVLTSFRLIIWMPAPPVLPDTFLGGSAPRLTYLHLSGIPFPALPKFLPICHELVDLHLGMIPDSGYISPESMAMALSALAKLKRIHIGFAYSDDYPDRGTTLSSSLTRVVLPALIRLVFQGSSEYFDDFAARIDTPAIFSVETFFFNHTQSDIPHFLQFISRTWVSNGRSFQKAKLYFADTNIDLRVSRRGPPGGNEFRTALSISIWCTALDLQVRYMAQICGKMSPLLSNVHWILIDTRNRCNFSKAFSDWKDYGDNSEWLKIFRAFSALQHMRIQSKLAEIVVSVLRELTGERVTNTLPMMHHLDLPPSTQQAIRSWMFLRQRFHYPVTVRFIATG